MSPLASLAYCGVLAQTSVKGQLIYLTWNLRFLGQAPLWWGGIRRTCNVHSLAVKAHCPFAHFHLYPSQREAQYLIACLGIGGTVWLAGKVLLPWQKWCIQDCSWPSINSTSTSYQEVAAVICRPSSLHHTCSRVTGFIRTSIHRHCSESLGLLCWRSCSAATWLL